MALTTTVGTGQIITPVWGNEIRDRTNQSFTNKAALDAGWPAAPDGSKAITLDNYRPYTRRAGVWTMDYDYGFVAAATFTSGVTAALPHSLARVPVIGQWTVGQNLALFTALQALTSTTITFRAFTAAGGVFAGTCNIYWYVA